MFENYHDKRSSVWRRFFRWLRRNAGLISLALKPLDYLSLALKPDYHPWLAVGVIGFTLHVVAFRVVLAVDPFVLVGGSSWLYQSVTAPDGFRSAVVDGRAADPPIESLTWVRLVLDGIEIPQTRELRIVEIPVTVEVPVTDDDLLQELEDARAKLTKIGTENERLLKKIARLTPDPTYIGQFGQETVYQSPRPGNEEEGKPITITLEPGSVPVRWNVEDCASRVHGGTTGPRFEFRIDSTSGSCIVRITNRETGFWETYEVHLTP